jgi:Glycosyltransferase family 92
MIGFFRGRPITRLTVEPRQALPDRHGIAVILIVKNEARHIGEWARFHHLAGVRHFYVYDNGSSDGTADCLRAALPADALTVTPWNQRLADAFRRAEVHNQVLAYAHAVQNFGAQYRWFATIDCDEFLVPRQHDDLGSALGQFSAPVLALPWVNFGRCGHSEIPQGGVLENYLLRERDPLKPSPHQRVKCIFDPCAVSAVSVHMMEGRDGSKAIPVGLDVVQLNHYYTRSDAELRAKMARGPNVKSRASKHEMRVMRRVEAIEADVVEDHAVLEFLAGRNVALPL